VTERPFFLTEAELRTLTGRAIKAKQIEWLKGQAIPFHVSATGHPVVVRSAIDGHRQPTLPPPRRTWSPALAEV
jgi:hypothetical protein